MDSRYIDQDKPTVQAIVDVIKGDDRIDWGEADIRVHLRDQTVVLVGTVSRLADKRRAEMAALKVKGVEHVDNRLLIEPVPKVSDERIKQHVLDALEQDPWIDDEKVAVSVDGGIVTLDGEAESLLRKRLIGATAWWVPGVRDVVNNLRVIYPEEDNDSQIVEACETVLEKDPFVDATEVLVRARNGVVTLLGTVCSEGEREMAESDCWYVIGVKDVVNKVAVVPTAETGRPAS